MCTFVTYLIMYPEWLSLLGGHVGLSPRLAVTQLSVFNCRFESNTSACFIENSRKFRIKCPNYFLCLLIYEVLTQWNYLFWFIPGFWLVNFFDEGSLPGITLSHASELTSTLYFLVDRSVYVLYTLIGFVKQRPK